MDHDVVLTFQTPFDPKLLRPLLRRLILPIAAACSAPFVLVGLAIELAGADRSLAVICVGSGIFAALFTPWHFASESVKRAAPKFGHMIAYRIDRTGVEILAGFHTRTLTWPEITRIDQRRNQVALYFGKRSVQSIPTGTLTAEQRAQFQHLLRSLKTNTAGPAQIGQRRT